MANTIALRRSTTAGAVPSAASLVTGEVSIVLPDRKIYAKRSDGTIKEMLVESGGAGGSAPTQRIGVSTTLLSSNSTTWVVAAEVTDIPPGEYAVRAFGLLNIKSATADGRVTLFGDADASLFFALSNSAATYRAPAATYTQSVAVGSPQLAWIRLVGRFTVPGPGNSNMQFRFAQNTAEATAGTETEMYPGATLIIEG